MLYVFLAVGYAVFVADALLFCYVLDHIGHDHHAEDHLYNLDGSLKNGQ